MATLTDATGAGRPYSTYGVVSRVWPKEFRTKFLCCAEISYEISGSGAAGISPACPRIISQSRGGDMRARRRLRVQWPAPL